MRVYLYIGKIHAIIYFKSTFCTYYGACKITRRYFATLKMMRCTIIFAIFVLTAIAYARAAKMVEQMAFDPLSPEGYLAQSGANGTQTAAQAVPEVALPPASQEPAEPTPMNLL